MQQVALSRSVYNYNHFLNQKSPRILQEELWTLRPAVDEHKCRPWWKPLGRLGKAHPIRGHVSCDYHHPFISSSLSQEFCLATDLDTVEGSQGQGSRRNDSLPAPWSQLSTGWSILITVIFQARLPGGRAHSLKHWSVNKNPEAATKRVFGR